MGKSTISMAIFNSYVKLPEGRWNGWCFFFPQETPIWLTCRCHDMWLHVFLDISGCLGVQMWSDLLVVIFLDGEFEIFEAAKSKNGTFHQFHRFFSHFWRDLERFLPPRVGTFNLRHWPHGIVEVNTLWNPRLRHWGSPKSICWWFVWG